MNNVMDLFAGIGGASYAGKLIGNWRTVCYVEWDKYCQQVIQQRIKDGIFDDAPIWGDIQTFDGKPWAGSVDIITAGFPCQPFSVAGQRRGEDDERNMWPETLRVIDEVRPRFAFLENVAGLITSGYFGRILGDLTEIGYDCRWTIVSAADVGAPHERKRLWILAYPVNSSDRGGRGQNTEADGIQGINRTTLCSRKSGGASQMADSNRARKSQSERNVQTQRGRLINGGKAQNPDLDESGTIQWWDIDPADLPDTDKHRAVRDQSTDRKGCGIEQDACHERFGEFKSELGRVAYGIPDRCNRLKGIGNAWVPAVAATAWGILNEEG